MNECRICKLLASGDNPINGLTSPSGISFPVYEDDTCIVILTQDKGGGNGIIVPKQHVASIFELDHQTFMRVSDLLYKFAHSLRSLLKPDYVSIDTQIFGRFRKNAHLMMWVSPISLDGEVELFARLLKSEARKVAEKLKRQSRRW